MSITPYNATGWNELMNGSLISAAYTMFNTAFAGWFVAILFFIYQFMLILKTRNLTISWVTGVIFVSLFALAQSVKAISVQVMFIILVFELAGILYYALWK